MSVRNNTVTLGEQISAALAALRMRGLPFVATPAAIRLEHDMAPFGDDDAHERGTPSINHLEGARLSVLPILPAPQPRTTWRVRYFLEQVAQALGDEGN